MGLKELLKNLGYADEKIQEILNAMKENNVYTSSIKDPDETIKKLQKDYGDLKTENDDLKKSKKDNASAGETISRLQDEIRKSKIETAAIMELAKAGAADVDYLMFKAEKSGELQKLKVDESGKVVGAQELADSLKKSYAAQFTAQTKGQDALVRTGIKKLEKEDIPDDAPKTLEEAITQKYSESDE